MVTPRGLHWEKTEKQKRLVQQQEAHIVLCWATGTKKDQEVAHAHTHTLTHTLTCAPTKSYTWRKKVEKRQEVKRKKKCMFCYHGDHSLVQWMQAAPLTASHGEEVLHTKLTHTCAHIHTHTQSEREGILTTLRNSCVQVNGHPLCECVCGPQAR